MNRNLGHYSVELFTRTCVLDKGSCNIMKFLNLKFKKNDKPSRNMPRS